MGHFAALADAGADVAVTAMDFEDAFRPEEKCDLLGKGRMRICMFLSFITFFPTAMGFWLGFALYRRLA